MPDIAYLVKDFTGGVALADSLYLISFLVLLNNSKDRIEAYPQFQTIEYFTGNPNWYIESYHVRKGEWFLVSSKR